MTAWWSTASHHLSGCAARAALFVVFGAFTRTRVPLCRGTLSHLCHLVRPDSSTTFSNYHNMLASGCNPWNLIKPWHHFFTPRLKMQELSSTTWLSRASADTEVITQAHTKASSDLIVPVISSCGIRVAARRLTDTGENQQAAECIPAEVSISQIDSPSCD